MHVRRSARMHAVPQVMYRIAACQAARMAATTDDA